MTEEMFAVVDWETALGWVWLLMPTPLLVWLALKDDETAPPLRKLMGFGVLWAYAGLVLGSQVAAAEDPGVLPLVAGFARWVRGQLSDPWVLLGMTALGWLLFNPLRVDRFLPFARNVRKVKVASFEVSLDTPSATLPRNVTAAAIEAWSGQGAGNVGAVLSTPPPRSEGDIRKIDADGQIQGEKPTTPPVAYTRFLHELPKALDAMPLEPGDAREKWFSDTILNDERSWEGEYAEELRLTAFGILERFRAQPARKGSMHRLGGQLGRSVMVRALMLVGYGDPDAAARLVDSLAVFDDDVVQGFIERDFVCWVLIALARERRVGHLEVLLSHAERLKAETTFEGRTVSVAASIATWLAWVAERPAPAAPAVRFAAPPSWRGHDLLGQAARVALAARDRDYHRAVRLAEDLMVSARCTDQGALRVAQTVARRTLALAWGALSMHDALQRLVANDAEAAADPLVLHVAARSLETTGHTETAGRLLQDALRKAREQGDTASMERLSPLVTAFIGG